MTRFTARTGMLGIVASGLVLGAGSAEAGLLSSNSGGAIPAYTGSQLFSASSTGFSVSANVDYAVFAPGAFGAAFPGQDPSNGTEYVYAYQIENFDTAVNKLTVGLDGDEPLGSVGFVSDAGLIDPSASLFVGSGPTSSAWDFAPNSLLNTSSSSILIFTSAAAPEWDSGTVSAQFLATHDLPSPLPEPASLGLIAAGAALVGLKRRPRA